MQRERQNPFGVQRLFIERKSEKKKTKIGTVCQLEWQIIELERKKSKLSIEIAKEKLRQAGTEFQKISLKRPGITEPEIKGWQSAFSQAAHACHVQEVKNKLVNYLYEESQIELRSQRLKGIRLEAISRASDEIPEMRIREIS